MPVRLKLRTPRFQPLAEALLESVILCKSYDSNCPGCPESKRSGSYYSCKIGLNAVSEARSIKGSKIVNEVFIATLDIAAHNYTGPEARDTFENALGRLVYKKKGKLNLTGSLQFY
jgi:hypothetical protein